MNNKIKETLFALLILLSGNKVYAYDIAVENADGVTFYYDYIKDGTELMIVGQKNCSGDLVIPKEVTYMNRTRKVTAISNLAFNNCHDLISVVIPDGLTTIYLDAFHNCRRLTSVTIPSSVTEIGNAAFSYCSDVLSVKITDIAAWCKIKFEGSAFGGNWHLYLKDEEVKDLVIPNSVTSIADYAFAFCKGLTSLTIPNSVTSIGESAFEGCTGLTSLTIPNSVTSIGEHAFDDVDYFKVVSHITNPFPIYDVFSLNTLNNATLYVPIGTIDKYKATKGWKNFLFIEEGTGEGGTTTLQKCEKPTISYQNGKLAFNCETDGAVCYSTITDTDIRSYSDNEIQLNVTYNISVYATKLGYENSEVATATLCWIDVEPQTEGISNEIAQIRSKAVMIQGIDGVLNVSGIDNGLKITVYSVSGQMVGVARAISNQTSIVTNLRKGEIGIVKVGDKSLKVVMQ